MNGMTNFIDLQKPFDTVDHSILLRRLEKMGFRGENKDLLRNYLHDRKQYVENKNGKSKISNIRFIVSQGSVLGSFLFLLYINDLTKTAENCQITCLLTLRQFHTKATQFSCKKISK